MQSKIEIKKFVNLSEAEDFVNNFKEKVIEIKFIPLFVPDIDMSKVVYFVFLKYSIK